MSKNKKEIDIKKQIEKDLMEQLKEKNATHAHYKELVQDYIDFWEIENKLKEDIAERGVSIYWCNGGGQEGYKKNDSISEMVKVSKQMLTILSDLGLKGAEYKAVRNEDDEEL
ncbi:P27 family phage terminase small subunit [Clostridium sp. Marseille-QA1073]